MTTETGKNTIQMHDSAQDRAMANRARANEMRRLWRIMSENLSSWKGVGDNTPAVCAGMAPARAV